MFDRVTIAFRGARHEIGRGRGFYGIWTLGSPRSQPLESWPETDEGWSAAWARFTGLEEPGSIAGQAGAYAGSFSTRVAAWASGRRSAALASALLLAGVACGIASLFPSYLGGASIASTPELLPAHAIYLAGWTVSAVLIMLGGARLRLGALFGVALSIVTFGLFFADVGTAIAGGANTAGAGLVLGTLGWLACAAGCGLAFLIRPGAEEDAPDGGHALVSLRRPRGAELGPVVMVVLAGLGVAAAFAPAWDSFTLRTAAGQTQMLTAGNAFASPGVVIVGNVAVMTAVAVVVIAAVLWRPVRHGAALLAGAAVPMAAQAIAALVQVSQPASATQFGISPAQASQLGLTISSGVTPAFWVYFGFLVALVVSCAWMLFTPHGGLAVPAAKPDPAGPYAWTAASAPAEPDHEGNAPADR